METLIDFARGPLFRFSVAVALLGLVRLAVLSVVELRDAYARAGDKSVSLVAALGQTLARLNPLRYLVRRRALYTITSVVFHASITLVPLFFSGHVRLWRRGLSVGWPALPDGVADILTLVGLAAAVLLIAQRASDAASRAMSRPQDWVLPLLIGLEMLTGYWLAHPGTGPMELDGLVLLHASVGDLLLIVTPFTKIAHCALLPLSQLALEMAWRFVPGAGRAVVRTLGKEGQPL